MTLIVTLLLLAAVVITAAYICFLVAYSVPKQTRESLYDMPDTEQYSPFAEESHRMIDEALSIPFEPVTVQSYDGFTLFGRHYPAAPDAPWLIMFHGYKSGAERDFCGGMPYGVKSGYNVLLVDQRAHGRSEGRCLTFGVKERHDCLTWINYVLSVAGPDAKIVLYGMSMGAATVLMAAGLELPGNIVGIVSDSGYSSPSGIIKKVLKDRHFPQFPTYSLLRLGGMLFGGFDIEEASAVMAMESCDIPVLFIHGEDDRFVPCEMGIENYEHCKSEHKMMLTVPGAGHGISYMVDRPAYLNAVNSFLDSVFHGV
ncbi:MAG: alpha/beta fold hydrolase [Eubacteriales bacterium]|nr:alpha/beta fold hydrolase [Eubacteriales bacterium]